MNGTSEAGETVENGTMEETVPEEDVLPLVPRNVSDKIGEGDFEVSDLPDTPLRIFVINSGHADSVLVTKGEFAMLVDAGNAAPVLSFLQSRNIRRLNVAVASKDSPDSIGGLEEVIGAVGTDEIWVNGKKTTSAQYGSVVGAAVSKGAVVKRPEAGDFLTVTGMEIVTLNPQKQRLEGSPESDAVALKVSYDGFCALLLHPTVQEREIAMLNLQESFACPVMTYYRHGEGRPDASMMVERAKPKDVVISVGQNSENLPSQTTLTRLNLKGANVWRTDVDGTVVVEKSPGGDYLVFGTG